jgi:peroxiredoxin
MRTYATIAAALILSLTTMLLAGEFNKTLSVGDVAPDFKDLVGTDDKPHSLADFDNKKILLVVFTCNTCEYARDLDKRLVTFADEYVTDNNKVGVIAINSNKVEGDHPPAMKKKAEMVGYTFPYVWDETQAIAKEYGTTSTPECFVLGPVVEGKRKIVYEGSFDNSPDGKDVKKKYVEEAVMAALEGKTPETTETQAIGCLVRWEKAKRKKK